MKEISASLLSADFCNLERDIRCAEDASVDLLHIDIMDGRFVPNITFGSVVTDEIVKKTKVQLDVHLMIVEPEKHIDSFVTNHTKYIVVHQEASVHLDRTLNYIKSQGIGCGVSLNPATPVSTIEHLLGIVDQILIMSVNPGYAGQKFIPYTLEKVRYLDEIRQEKNYNYKIAMDGGISLKNVSEVAKAGTDIIVAGSAVFGAEDIGKAITALKEEANEHTK